MYAWGGLTGFSNWSDVSHVVVAVVVVVVRRIHLTTRQNLIGYSGWALPHCMYTDRVDHSSTGFEAPL